MKSSAEIERPGLSRGQVEQFIQQGFIKVEAAFSREIAAEARALLWQLTGCDPQDPSTWTLPVVRLGDCAQEPFRAAVNTGALHAAFDQLVGPGQWLPRQSLGGFPIRFPHLDDPGDSGWHVDASFPPDNPSSHYFEWRINIQSRERALLMLFLFSDVDEQDAPTRIRIGSHLRVAPARAGRNNWNVIHGAGCNGRSSDSGSARDHGHRSGRHSLPVPSISGPRSAADSRNQGQISRSATVASARWLRSHPAVCRTCAGCTGNRVRVGALLNIKGSRTHSDSLASPAE